MNQHLKFNASVAPFTTFNVGGVARAVVSVFDTDGLLRAIDLNSDYVVLGRGSKVLFSDKGFCGTVILMRSAGIKNDQISPDLINPELISPDLAKNLAKNDGRVENDKNAEKIDVVYAQAGVMLPTLSRHYAKNSLSGFEFAISIPASVGGAIKTNAGAYSQSISDILVYADVLRNGQIKRILASECGFSYRKSQITSADVVLGGCFLAKKGDAEEILQRQRANITHRKATQPVGCTCGSVFVNPPNDSAGRLIEECGLKNLAINSAKVSPKHANFIINEGGAKARDIYNLIRTIKAEVYTQKGIKLKEEVIYIGEF